MENSEPETIGTIIPVPKPRKIFLKKSDYENVAISNESPTKENGNNDKYDYIDNKIQLKPILNNQEKIFFEKQKQEFLKSQNDENIKNYPVQSKENNVKICFEKLENQLSRNNNDLVTSKPNIIHKQENKEYESVYLKKLNEANNFSILPSNNTSSVTSRASTPEPFYVNQEQFSENHNFLNINLEASCDVPLHREVLYEFDPLMRQRNSTKNELSNQLLLLENLLQDDIYSNVFDGLQLNSSPNEEISDEDNIIDDKFLPPTPTRVDSLESNLYSKPFKKAEKHKDDIEHKENFINSTVTKCNDTSKDNIDEIQSKKTQSSWYLNEPNEFNYEVNEIEGNEIPPPPYSEHVGRTSFQKRVTSISDNINFNIHGRTEINKMISNFCNKISVLKRKPSLKTTHSNKEICKKLENIPKPSLTEAMVRHEGFLIKFPSGAIEDIFKELQNRKAIIRDYKFLAYQESELKNLKESISLHEISTIQCVSNSKITENSTHYYCFEITTVSPKVLATPKLLNSSANINNWKNKIFKVQRMTHLYGISKESERDLWMQKLLQSLTDVFPCHLTCQFYRVGWCYLKKSITTEWSGTWVMLTKRKRKLFIFTESELSLEKLDLRKARCIVMKEFDNSIENLCVEQGPILMIDCPPFSVYMIMSCPRETKIWKHIIREVACNNGPGLDEQQLTKHNVPVIIDKCINFIYIHGSMSEGIYRKSGSENSIQKLIYEFRSNAFNVEITKTEYTEHDVANVLKRFMRNLPQRLLGKYSESFISVSQLNSASDKITSYKELLSRLSSIEFMTAKKIINHLSFIQSQNRHNKMTLENLAVVWGQTLLQIKTGNEDLEYNKQESEVIIDLILNFKTLFPLSKDEINKEKSMLHYLKKYYAASESLNELTVKQSGDLKVWIVLKLDASDVKSEEQSSICVILNPNRTAIDICKEIAPKINKTYREFCLFEEIFNNCLERPINDDEKLFHTVLRWSYWPEEDRKNNTLVIKSSKFLEKMYRTLDIMKNYTLKKALQYADNKTKTFKLHEIELNGTKLSVKKLSKSGNTTHKNVDLHLKIFSIYLGSERKISFDWALTFIENNQTLSLKNPETSFPGHVIGGNNKDDQIIVFSNLWKNVYGDIKLS